MKNLTPGKSTLLLAILMGVSAGSEAGDQQGITFSPMLGKAFFAKNRHLDDENFYSFALGYNFNETWSAELAYLNSEPTISNTNIEAELKQFRLDALYHFNTNTFRPFLVAGLGESNFDAGFVEEDDTSANIGAGFKYMFNEALALRSEIRLVQGLDSGESDYLAGIGLHFQFGKSSKASTPVVNEKPAAKDGDKDGVEDSLDKCLSTPANSPVDASGCAINNDIDNDGVLNHLDKCPQTKAGAKVDENGCYKTLKENISINLHINFANNSDEVVSNAYQEVKRVADFMQQYPQAKVSIEGHTDDRGAASYNQQLSQRRADAVAKILTSEFNISSERVTSIGKGEAEPLTSNDTAENRAKNRRVVAVVNATVENTQN